MDAVSVRPVIWKRGCLASASFAFLLSAITPGTLAQAPNAASAPPAEQSSSPSTTSQPKDLPPPSSQSAAHQNELADENPVVSAGAFSLQTTDGEIKEDALKQMLTGKPLYLRQGFQDNNLEFDEQGRLTGHARQGSFTLSQIQINKIKLSKHKLELEGDRYALHFLGAAPYEDPTKATDRVKITPKKKSVRISFEREQVEKPKKEKDKDKNDRKHHSKDQPNTKQQGAEPQTATMQQPDETGNSRSLDKGTAKTTSPAQASQLLVTALDKVFSRGIDDRMIAAMPDFWKLYYQAAAAKADLKPTDPAVLQQSAVDQKAKLVSVLDPPSNEFAQANGVAGIALYHAIVGSDGKVEQVVAGRPIGFGLDENAEQAIRKATFQPAIKDGKPVPVFLDLVVSFRIYSKRTSEPEMEQAAQTPDQRTLPGPYTAQAMEQARAQAAQQTPQQTQQTQPNQPNSGVQTENTAQPAAQPAQNPAPVQSPAPQ